MTQLDGRSFWAVTTYFNPVRFGSRRHNYDVFRRSMGLPLLTIELGYGDSFDLGPNDADILVQISGRSILWQKERLLNIALRALPAEALAVAWLDCDVVFQRRDWVAAACQTLEIFPIAQLFEFVHDLSGEDDGAVPQGNISPTGLSVAASVLGRASQPTPSVPTEGQRQCAYGLAWASMRCLLERHGFYDAMILGGGDRALACAAYGRFKEFIQSAQLDAGRTAHYLRWATRFFDDVRGRVGCVPGGITHLWHGDIADRRYLTRHSDLARIGLDLESDIAVDEAGCWTWASERPELHDLVRAYFEQRREDDVRHSLQDLESSKSGEFSDQTCQEGRTDARLSGTAAMPPASMVGTSLQGE